MNKKVTSVFAYLGLIFWLIGFFAGDKEGAKFHLNQGLVLAIANIACSVLSGLSVIPVIGMVFALVGCVASVAVLVFAIMGIVSAVKEEEKPLPLIGKIQILK